MSKRMRVTEEEEEDAGMKGRLRGKRGRGNGRKPEKGVFEFWSLKERGREDGEEKRTNGVFPHVCGGTIDDRRLRLRRFPEGWQNGGHGKGRSLMREEQNEI